MESVSKIRTTPNLESSEICSPVPAALQSQSQSPLRLAPAPRAPASPPGFPPGAPEKIANNSCGLSHPIRVRHHQRLRKRSHLRMIDLQKVFRCSTRHHLPACQQHDIRS